MFHEACGNLASKTPTGTSYVILSAEVSTASGRTVIRPISLLYLLEVTSDADIRALPDHEEASAKPTKKMETSTQERRVTRSMTKCNRRTHLSTDVTISSTLTLLAVTILTVIVSSTANDLSLGQISPFRHVGTYACILEFSSYTLRSPRNWASQSLQVYKQRLCYSSTIKCDMMHGKSVSSKDTAPSSDFTHIRRFNPQVGEVYVPSVLPPL
ncbi:hypothetical protein AB6A40_003100 [Gnathostoma spinigerum]|uniref:Uncharacterized protein n=1 Tax=Gnathostoma spinigerum TaxID=75299 RepID=A0ABD6EG69_9BILA